MEPTVLKIYGPSEEAAKWLAKSLCGLGSISKYLDERNMPLHGSKALLAAIHEFEGGTYPNRPYLAAHLQYTFVIYAEPKALTDFLCYCPRLSITISKQYWMMLVSGSAADFASVIKEPNKEGDNDHFWILTHFYHSLVADGLESLFQGYVRNNRGGNRHGPYELVKQV